MYRAMRLALAATVGAAALVGCGASETRWTGETASYVVYAKQLPLYPGSKARDSMGSESWGDTADSYSEGMAVWFEVKGYEKDKVLSWYEGKLSNATTQVLDSGSIQLTVPVPNGEPGEEMGVVIEDDGYRVFENTKAGKHKKS